MKIIGNLKMVVKRSNNYVRFLLNNKSGGYLFLAWKKLYQAPAKNSVPLLFVRQYNQSRFSQIKTTLTQVAHQVV
jgi:hypothetical protein